MDKWIKQVVLLFKNITNPAVSSKQFSNSMTFPQKFHPTESSPDHSVIQPGCVDTEVPSLCLQRASCTKASPENVMRATEGASHSPQLSRQPDSR